MDWDCSGTTLYVQYSTRALRNQALLQEYKTLEWQSGKAKPHRPGTQSSIACQFLWQLHIDLILLCSAEISTTIVNRAANTTVCDRIKYKASPDRLTWPGQAINLSIASNLHTQ